MDSSIKKGITRNFTFIKESICDDLGTFVDGFIEKDIFDIDIKEELKSAKTAKTKSDILICKILVKGPVACDAFIDLLHKKNYADVLRKIYEVRTEGDVPCDGASGRSVGNYRDRTFIVRSFAEEKGACGEDPPTPDLAARDKSQLEYIQSNYKQLQTTYSGLREQLAEKRNQLFKLNQHKVAMEKELKEVSHENQSLHNANVNLKNEEVRLKAEINVMERLLGQKENEISKINQKIDKMEQMWKEEKESRERLEKTVNDQSTKIDNQIEMMTSMSDVLKDIQARVGCNQDQSRTDSTQGQVETGTHRRRQLFMPGTNTKRDTSHNINLKR